MIPQVTVVTPDDVIVCQILYIESVICVFCGTINKFKKNFIGPALVGFTLFFFFFL
jgi:hypothetical protein